MLGDRCTVDFVRAVSQAQGALHGPPMCQREVLGDSGTTVNLDGAVDHLERDVWRHYLDLCDFARGDLVAHRVHHVGRIERQQARHVDLDPALGDVIEVGAQPCQWFAERGPVHGALAHQFQCTLGTSDGAHAMVNTAWAKAALSDLETAALAQQHVLVRHTNVFQQDFGMAVRRIVVAKHR